jgi:1-deoxy-D-xylulose-5-phosphate synthase
VITTKGKGLKQAEENQVKYHAPGKFDAASGEILSKSEELTSKIPRRFGLTVLDLAKKKKKIIGITPAMPQVVL